jgi:hypothetical protein
MIAFVIAQRIHAAEAPAPGAGQFLGVDWGAFVVVFLVALAVSAVVVIFYSLGLRLLAVGSADDMGADGSIVLAAHGQRPLGASIGGYLCLAIGIAAVLYGLYWIIPQFH